MTPTTTYLSQPQTNQHQKTTVPDLLQSASLLINSLQEHKKSKKAPIGRYIPQQKQNQSQKKQKMQRTRSNPALYNQLDESQWLWTPPGATHKRFGT